MDSDIVWSTPEQPCEFDLRILPEKLNPQPEFIYIDYFIYSEMNGSTALGYEECIGCDPFAFIDSFFETLSADGSVDLCEAKDWDIADSMMILDFGDESGEVYFFMKWDTNGTYFEFLDNGRIDTKEFKDRFEARSLLER
ncbi:MAG: hypothetical protein AAF600_17475 [Bacteroidota bacterium]